MTTHQHYVSTSPTYPGLMETSSSWEKSYQQRARSMTRDYVNPNSTRLSYRRSRSADSRPQYTNSSRRGSDSVNQENDRNNSRESSTGMDSAACQLENGQAPGCLNMFYPTVNESRATVSYDTTSSKHSSHLPKPSGRYQSGLERSARSVSPPSRRGRSSSSSARFAQVPADMIDPYDVSSALRLPANLQTSSSSSIPAPVTPQRHEYDYLKNSLIMFGEDHSSIGTGLSQQELLQRKRREQTTARRKEKKQRSSPSRRTKSKERIVNLPPSLFNPHSNRQHQQEVLRKQEQENAFEPPESSLPLQETPEYVEEPTMSSIGSRGLHPLSFEQSEPLVTFAVNTTPTRGRGFTPRGPTSPDPPADRTTDTAQTMGSNPSQESKGWRSSMVNRMRKTSSSSRRWNIIPSLSRSRSRSQSPGRSSLRSGSNQSGAFSSLNRPQLSQTFHQHPNETSQDEGSTEYRLDPPRKSLDPPSQVTNSYMSDGSKEWSFLDGHEKEDNEFPHFSSSRIRGAKEENTQHNSRTEWGSVIRQSPPVIDSEDFGVSPSFQDRSLYTREQAIPFDLSEGENWEFPSAKAPATSLSPSTQFTPQGASRNIGDSDLGAPVTDTSELTSSFDPFTTTPTISAGEGRKTTPRYRLEPKDYSQISDAGTRKEETSRRNRIKSQLLASVAASHSKEPTPTELDYRDTKAYSQYDGISMTASRLNNPPGLDMNLYAIPKPDAPEAATPSKELNLRRFKTSPTSVTDLQNPNVRWSDNLNQLPTPSSTTMERPRSILRKSRPRLINVEDSDCPSDETPTETKGVRISDEPASRGQFISEHPSAMGFVDIDGRALSPILDNSVFPGDEHHDPATRIATSFEKNIPEEFQRAFLAENALSKSDFRSGGASNAYSDFIESVASVVVQTAARQFLAKLQVQKMRDVRSRSAVSSQQINRVAIGKKRMQSKSSKHEWPSMFDVAATRIQSAYRGWYARDCITVDNYCATIIQKNYRAHRCRSRFLFDGYRIVQVQSVARRKMSYDIFATCMYCIVAIQAAFRGHRVRKWISPRRAGLTDSRYQTRAGSRHQSRAGLRRESPHVPRREASDRMYPHRAATTIQAKWRSFTCEMAFLRAYEDILLVQSIARGWVTRRLIRSWLHAHNIQASSTLLGQRPRQQRKKVDTYKLPRTYHNHTEFMKKSIPSPIRSHKDQEQLYADSMHNQPDQQDSHQETPLRSIQAPRANNAPIERQIQEQEFAERSARETVQRRDAEMAAHEAEMERRRFEREHTQRAAFEEAQHREADRVAHEAQVREQQERQEQSGSTVQSQLDPRGNAALNHRPTGLSENIAMSSSTPFDQEMDEENTSAMKLSSVDMRRRQKEMERKSVLEKRQRKDDEAASHAEEIRERRRKMERKAEVRRQEEEQAKCALLSHPGLNAGPNGQSRDALRPNSSSNTTDRLEQPKDFQKTTRGTSGGSDYHTSTVLKEPTHSRQPIRPTGSQIDQNKSTGASRILAGWRSLEKTGSFDKRDVSQRESSPQWPRNRPAATMAVVEMKKPRGDWKGAESPLPATSSHHPEPLRATRLPSSDSEGPLNWEVTRGAGPASPKQHDYVATETANSLARDMEALKRTGIEVKRERDTAANAIGGHVVRTEREFRTPKEEPSSFYMAMRKNRSNEEQRRLDKMHSMFVRSGLMQPSTENKVSNEVESQQNRQEGDHRLIDNHTQIQQHTSVNEIHDEKKDDAVRPNQKPQRDTLSPFNYRDSSQPASCGQLHNGGRKQNSGTPKSDFLVLPQEASTSTAAVPIGHRGLPGGKSSEQHAVQSPQDTSSSGIPSHTTSVHISSSTIHVEMRSKRNESERKRIDEMHRAFLCVGLIGGRQEKEKISFANTTSAEYEGNKHVVQNKRGTYGEPSASDVMHAWRGRDQTQPMMRGKLF